MLKDKIRHERRNLALTQVELADLMGVNELSVRNWERGKCAPSMQHLVKLSLVLNVSLDEMFEEERRLLENESDDEI